MRKRRARSTLVAVVAAVTVAATGALPGPVSAQAASPHVAAYPSPNTKTASPRTQISFRNATRGSLRSVRVNGSRSGRHRGRLAAHSDGRGLSFLPNRPFASGERVTVTGVDVAGAGRHPYSFRVARFTPNPPLNRRLGRTAAAGTMSLVTRPDLRPPRWDVRVLGPAASTAEIIAGPKLLATRSGRQGAQILTAAGKVLFWWPLPLAQKPADVRVQAYRGQPALTFWQGYLSIGQGDGEGVIMDPSYRVLKRVRAANGYRMDLHEFRLTPQGTALLLAYQAVEYDMRSVRGPENGRVTDAVVQEIDLATGLVIFEWHSLGNVALGESTWRRPPRPPAPAPAPGSTTVPPAPPAPPWDYVHANSVSLDGPGAIVLSGRHTDAVYRIHRNTGTIDWRLGGARSDFRARRGASFARQHDAEVQPDGAVRLFDNSARRERRRSRVITLRLDRRARSATLVRTVDRADRLYAGTQGNAAVLDSGSTFVDWGSQGAISEIGPGNRLTLDAWLPPGWDSYRAYRADWTGTPLSRPAVVARAAGGATRVYASWNGATRVASWRVLGGAAPNALVPVGATAWQDLETALSVPSGGPYFAVQALDAQGAVLATSQVTRRR
jgi:hypothetical protein